jgi:hypothetical protein
MLRGGPDKQKGSSSRIRKDLGTHTTFVRVPGNSTRDLADKLIVWYAASN